MKDNSLHRLKGHKWTPYKWKLCRCDVWAKHKKAVQYCCVVCDKVVSVEYLLKIKAIAGTALQPC